ncbi:MAG: hypothetical protein J0M08_10765 [Bacteroidetes bacterium]|nr:hypothetical protein [Bacteroidota bacterium]
MIRRFIFRFVLLVWVIPGLSVALPPGCSTPGTDGPLAPNVTYTVAIAGSTSVWSNVDNAKVSDNAYATNATDLANNNEYTDYLCARDFGLTYPADCNANVVTFSVEISSANASTIKDYQLRYIINGGIQTQCDHINTSFWSTTDANRGYTFPLGNYCISESYVKSAYFGIAIAAKRAAAAGSAGTAKIDRFTLSVQYGGGVVPCAPDDPCSYLSNLPIELTSFELFSTKRNQVDLEWTTISENNNDFFSIERSSDGVNFTPVGTVDGAGNSMSMLHYKFSDVSAPAGENYYRLKQTDFDGQVTTSRLRWVWVKSDNDIFVTYSDDAKEATIHFLELPQVMPHIVFVNAMGQYVKVPVNTEDMLDGHLKIDLSTLSSGVYYISVFDNTLKASKPIVVSN